MTHERQFASGKIRNDNEILTDGAAFRAFGRRKACRTIVLEGQAHGLQRRAVIGTCYAGLSSRGGLELLHTRSYTRKKTKPSRGYIVNLRDRGQDIKWQQLLVTTCVVHKTQTKREKNPETGFYQTVFTRWREHHNYWAPVGKTRTCAWYAIRVHSKMRFQSHWTEFGS